jgi:anti-anti-sigma factor
MTAPDVGAAPEVARHVMADRVVLLSLAGELDLASVPSLSAGFAALEVRPYRRVVLDLTDVTFMSAAALHVLLDLHRRARAEGFRVILVGAVRREVERTLSLAGVYKLFDFRPTVAAAVRP